jgi:hypothetical protein
MRMYTLQQNKVRKGAIEIGLNYLLRSISIDEIQRTQLKEIASEASFHQRIADYLIFSSIPSSYRDIAHAIGAVIHGVLTKDSGLIRFWSNFLADQGYTKLGDKIVSHVKVRLAEYEPLHYMYDAMAQREAV